MNNLEFERTKPPEPTYSNIILNHRVTVNLGRGKVNIISNTPPSHSRKVISMRQ